MNWKARAIATQDLPETKLSGYITRGKPIPYEEGIRLVGMLLRERGDAPEGVKASAPSEKKEEKKESKKAEPTHIQQKKEAAKAKANPGEYVSSEDMKTPWKKMIEDAKTDDRLETAIRDGIITPVKA